MPSFNAGRVQGGEYLDGQLAINSTNLGALTVAADDAGDVLRDAIGAVAGMSAELDGENSLVITGDSAFIVGGSRPLGAEGETVENLHPGTYE